MVKYPLAVPRCSASGVFLPDDSHQVIFALVDCRYAEFELIRIDKNCAETYHRSPALRVLVSEDIIVDVEIFAEFVSQDHQSALDCVRSQSSEAFDLTQHYIAYFLLFELLYFV